MYGHNLLKTHERLKDLGVVGSERSFCRWLGVGHCVVRDHRRTAGLARVSRRTVEALRARLVETSEQVPAALAGDLGAILADLDQAEEVAAFMHR